MPRRPDLLNVRQHLKHLDLVLEDLNKYGLVPAVKYELRVLRLINRAILKRSDAKRAGGNRHDLYVGGER